MRREFFVGVTAAVILIAWLEWPKLMSKPKRDRAMFICLLLLGWLVSMLDLTNTPGPTTVLQAIFRPFKGWVDQ